MRKKEMIVLWLYLILLQSFMIPAYRNIWHVNNTSICSRFVYYQYYEGGGGGGAYWLGLLDVNPGDNISCIIGSGGSAQGGNGSSSKFGNSYKEFDKYSLGCSSANVSILVSKAA